MGKVTASYNSNTVTEAIAAIKNGMTMYKASKVFKIPRSTLQDKVKGKYKEGAKRGPPTVLSKTEETNLVEWIIHLGKMGFPITKEHLLDSVSHLCKQMNRENPFDGGRPGRHWYEAFLKRNPEITKRVSQSLTKNRSEINENAIRNWFKYVQKYLDDHDLNEMLIDPNRFYNCDETAFCLSSKEKCVLVKKGTTAVYNRTANDEKECLTVLIVVNANGELPPPMVLLPYKRIPQAVLQTMPNKWGFRRSESGWMTCETFFEYVTNVFYPYLIGKNSKFHVIPFANGHSSHISLHLNEFCKEKQIILVT